MQQPPSRDSADDAGELAPATVAVVAGRPAPTPDAPFNVPVVMASTYHAGGDVGYGRFGNPTWGALEEAVGALEGGTAVAFGSGTAAVAAALDLVPVGGVVVAPERAYSGTLALLRRLAERELLTVRPVDVEDAGKLAAACEGAALVWLESIANPTMEAVDVAAAARAAHAAGATVVVDATFATPLLQRPLALGADVVVHSATKYLSGHSDALMGLTVSSPETADLLRGHRTAAGAVPGTLEAYLVLRGLRTLHLRVERSQASAAELARRAAAHPAVTRVRYPGWGAMLAVEVADAARADAVVSAVRLWGHATSLGGVESMLERRRKWALESPSVPEGLLRLSVGVEDVEDLWKDLSQALDAVAR